MVRVGQHQRLDARKVLGRRKLPQVWVVERLQVQQPVQALGGEALENVLADVPADARTLDEKKTRLMRDTGDRRVRRDFAQTTNRVLSLPSVPLFRVQFFETSGSGENRESSTPLRTPALPNAITYASRRPDREGTDRLQYPTFPNGRPRCQRFG